MAESRPTEILPITQSINVFREIQDVSFYQPNGVPLHRNSMKTFRVPVFCIEQSVSFSFIQLHFPSMNSPSISRRLRN